MISAKLAGWSWCLKGAAGELVMRLMWLGGEGRESEKGIVCGMNWRGGVDAVCWEGAG